MTALGPGRRIGLWLQGCSIGCVGCCSRDTWEADASKYIDLSVLISWCKQISVDGFEGVTVSGGEPFEQPEALHELLSELRIWRTEASLDFDILVYSGYSLSRLKRSFVSILRLADVVVPGPYVASLPSEVGLTGSSNQRLYFCNTAVQRRYLQWQADQSKMSARKVQIAIDEAGVWFIGIPRAGDLAKLESRCRDSGLELIDPSWRA